MTESETITHGSKLFHKPEVDWRAVSLVPCWYQIIIHAHTLLSINWPGEGRLHSMDSSAGCMSSRGVGFNEVLACCRSVTLM